MLTYKTILLSLLLSVSQAKAYTIVIVTDQKDLTRAKADIAMLKESYPFSKFDINFKIARVPEEQLKCGAILGIDRLVSCPEVMDKLNTVTKKLGGSQTVVLKDSHGLDNKSHHGGSAAVGGSLMVATTGAHARTTLHEIIHSFGFTDEYVYSESDSNQYCKKGRASSKNSVEISPDESYASDASARQKHGGQIPWYSYIRSSTLITNSGGTKLGTQVTNEKDIKFYPINNSIYPSPFDEVTGLFPLQTCMRATEKMHLWKPNASIGIMGELHAGLGRNMEDILEEAMRSRGIEYKVGFADTNQKEASLGRLEKEIHINESTHTEKTSFGLIQSTTTTKQIIKAPFSSSSSSKSK